jgi:hypothetical protein
VSNTENHVIPDSTTVGDDVPAEHTYTAFWQGALHHQGAHATWTWEEPVEPTLAGHISMRPANIYAGGKAMLDLNRLAEEVTAIHRAKARVALLLSMSSIYWEKDLEETNKNVYTLLTFMGQQVTYVSERQLASGKYADVDWIVLPHATHVMDSTVKALDAFVKKGGKVVFVGEGNLAFDEYHRKRTLDGELAKAPTIQLHDDSARSMSVLRQVMAGQGLKTVELLDADGQTPAWGVEYRTVAYKGGMLVPITNMLAKTVTVRLSMKGRAVDLITGQAVDMNRLELKPMAPHLIRIDSK